MKRQNSAIKNAFSGILDGECSMNDDQEARYTRIMDSIDEKDTLILTNDAFIINKLTGDDALSEVNKEKISIIEKDSKCKSTLISGEKYKDWMLKNKELIITHFKLQDECSYINEIKISPDDLHAHYDFQDKILLSMKQGMQLLEDVRASCSIDTLCSNVSKIRP